MHSKLYDVLKFIFTIVLPASLTLYTALATIWGWPYKDAITASVAAFITFGCAVLMIDSKSFFKDKMIITLDGDDPEE